MEIDLQDREIVAALQQNARLTNGEVAAITGLSHSSCSRRIKRLEDNGVLRGYRALVNRDLLGQSVRAFVGVVRQSGERWQDVAEILATVDGVVACYVMSGEVDILLEIVATDMNHYSGTILETVLAVPGVDATRSAFVFKEMKSAY